MYFITNLSNLSSYDFIFIIVYCFTKMTYFFLSCIKTITNKETTKLFFENIYCYYKLVKDIISKKEAQLISSFWKKNQDITDRPKTIFDFPSFTLWINRTNKSNFRIRFEILPSLSLRWLRILFPLIEFAYNYLKQSFTL